MTANANAVALWFYAAPFFLLALTLFSFTRKRDDAGAAILDTILLVAGSILYLLVFFVLIPRPQ